MSSSLKVRRSKSRGNNCSKHNGGHHQSDHKHHQPRGNSTGRKKQEPLSSIPLDPTICPETIKYHLDFLSLIDIHGDACFYKKEIIENAIRRYERIWIPLIHMLNGTDELADLNLAPPLDVHWVWHCHMLAPSSYRTDLQATILGRAIRHRPRSLAALKELRDRTRMIWNTHFPEEPFDLSGPTSSEFDDDDISRSIDLFSDDGTSTLVSCSQLGGQPSISLKSEKAATSAEKQHSSNFSYDILKAALRQKSFYYQVSLPHYRKTAFLQKCLFRYKMYLKLKQLHPDVFLVPCYDIDIAWHTHQVCPTEYLRDTGAILGGILPHDDSVNDRAPGSKLSNSESTTRRLWRTTFHAFEDLAEFTQPGAMYRGQPPNGRLAPLGDQSALYLGHVELVSFESFKYESEKPLKADPEMYQVKIYTFKIEAKDAGSSNQTGTTTYARRARRKFAFRLKALPTNVPNLPDKAQRHRVYFDSSDKCLTVPEGCDAEIEFEVELRKKSGLKSSSSSSSNKVALFSCLSLGPSRKTGADDDDGRTKVVAETTRPVKCNDVDGDSSLGGALRRGRNDFASDMYRSGTLTGVIIKSLQDNERVHKKLVITPGSFYDCVMPENVEALWGPIPLERLPPGIDNKCKAVTHQICDVHGNKFFSVYLIHSLPLEMSAIQLFVGEKMAVVAHLVGPDTIGHYYKELGLDDEFRYIPWRAMLIKDNDGDWAICTAAWKGMKAGTPGIPGTRHRKAVPGTPGKPGYFKLFYLNLRNGKKESTVIPEGFSSSSFQGRRYRFSLPNLYVDLERGSMVLLNDPKSGDQMAQHVCLAFTVSLLFLMVQPRPADLRDEDVEEARNRLLSVHTSSRNAIPVRPLYIESAALAFLVYCGWKHRDDIPTNSTLRHVRGYGAAAGCLASMGCLTPAVVAGTAMTVTDSVNVGGCGGCAGCGSSADYGGGLFGGGGGGEFGDYGASGFGGGEFGDYGAGGGFGGGLFGDGGGLDGGGGGDGGGACGGCGGCGG